MDGLPETPAARKVSVQLTSKLFGIAGVLALLGGMGIVASVGADAAQAVTFSPVSTTGTLTLTDPYAAAGAQLSFDYATDRPAELNWVALYENEADGPYDQKFHKGATQWVRATADHGTVTLSSAGLHAGHNLTAYFLAEDGYSWLAQPVTFQLGLTKPTGSLTMSNVDPKLGDTLHFAWATDRPDPTNWIGLYDAPNSVPIDGTSHGASTRYRYVTEGNSGTGAGATSGTIDIDTAKLTAGHPIAVYFMHADGYVSLAPALMIRLVAPTLGSGSLTLTSADPTQGDVLQFSYTTDHPNAMNFVALYDNPADGPTDQKFHAASTVWTRADGTAGTVSLSTVKLTAGHPVSAYFLYNDGYEWLSVPISFTLAPSQAPAVGTLTLDNPDAHQGDALTFSYTTNKPNAHNWIGLYDPASGGPTDQKYHSGSTVWTYVDGTSGTVTLTSAALSDSTDIGAYLLFDDGYTWLAQPMTFQLKPAAVVLPTVGPHFATDAFSTTAAPVDSTQKVDVSGLWFGSTPVGFTKADGDAWLSVSPAGMVTARVPANRPQHPGTITVTATDAAGHSGRVEVDVPVAAPSTRPTLKAATLNQWDAGSHVTDATEKLVRSILINRLDVVGLQETGGTGASAIGARLGWFVSESPTGLGIVSRYPLTERALPAIAKATATAAPAITATVTVGARSLTVWVAGLDAADAGPDRACVDGATDLAAHEKTTLRYAQAQSLAASMHSDVVHAKQTPVVLLADLESPSESDWTPATAAQHCAVGAVAWPVPKLLAVDGLKDTFRVAHPDAATDAGITSSPVRPLRDGTTQAQPQDRVDYIEAAGVTVVESHTLVDGFPAVLPEVAANTWTSDHAAVVTTLDLSAVPTAPAGSGAPQPPVQPGSPAPTHPQKPTRPTALHHRAGDPGAATPVSPATGETSLSTSASPTPAPSSSADPDGAGVEHSADPSAAAPDVTPVLASSTFLVLMVIAIVLALLLAALGYVLFRRARAAR